jgi:hypothetical protein
VGWGAKTSHATDPIPSATSTTSSATTPSTATSTATPPASVAPPPSSPPSAPTAPIAPATSRDPERPATSASADKPGRVQVSLLGDPGTHVSVDGASRGACPAFVALEPGQHEVRFVFDPTGESRGERFSVKAGERVQIRAQFTGATPTIKIQR